jgi:hypothetical protein
LGGSTTKNIVAVILRELIALERHWDFWSGSVCGAAIIGIAPQGVGVRFYRPIQRRRRHGKFALLDIQNDNQ